MASSLGKLAWETVFSAMELYGWMAAFGLKTKSSMSSVWSTVCKVGREDPRRAIHALKVGFALTLVSLLYLLEPFFKGIGQNAVVAVITVAVVLEFSAGATLCRGLNRGIGTVLAGTLAFFIEFIAHKWGRVFQAVFIGVSVFLVGTATTYMRFIPYIKRNYDYGMVIFLLTFNLITVSSYRVENVLRIAHDRLYTIAIGCGVCLLMSLLVFPIWSGQDLHNATVSKLEGLATLIPACVNEYFAESDHPSDQSREKSEEDPVIKAVLDSKATDETLAMYASWEPWYSMRHFYRVPCKQYVKLGAVLRHIGYTVAALHGCLQTEIQTPKSVRAMFKNPCIKLGEEVSKVLEELSNSIRNHRHCSPELLSDRLKEALHDLNNALKSQPKLFLGSNTHSHQASLLAYAAAMAATDNNNNSMPGKNDLPKTNSSGDRKYNNNKKELPKEQRIKTSMLRPTRSEVPKDERKTTTSTMLRPTLSKVAITTLEFAEALPFAAFASLLVEIVARLDLVIEEVEELARISHFKEYYCNHNNPAAGGDQVVITCDGKVVGNTTNANNRRSSEGSVQRMENGLHNHLRSSHGCEI